MAIHSPRKLTYEDFAKIPEDRQRHEILDGAHVVSPAPTPPHQDLAFGVARKIADFADAHGLGKVYLAPLDVLLSAHDIVEPDVLFVAASRLGIVGEANVQGAPDLVIEIVSPSTRRRDLGQKRARYEQLGVQEYWVFELEPAAMLIFRRAGDRFLPPLRLTAENDDRLTTPLLPGWGVSLRSLFAR